MENVAELNYKIVRTLSDGQQVLGALARTCKNYQYHLLSVAAIVKSLKGMLDSVAKRPGVTFTSRHP
jgi:hypothetical protein